jgi:hypothetical protein
MGRKLRLGFWRTTAARMASRWALLSGWARSIPLISAPMVGWSGRMSRPAAALFSSVWVDMMFPFGVWLVLYPEEQGGPLWGQSSVYKFSYLLNL